MTAVSITVRLDVNKYSTMTYYKPSFQQTNSVHQV